MQVKSLRFWSLLPFIAALLMIAYAIYEQKVELLEPCPLCMVQRYIIGLVGLLYLLTSIKPPQNLFRKIVAVFISLVAAFGAAVSARHVWIQHLPEDEVPACGPGLDYMVDNFPFSEVIKELLHGSGECAEIVWRFMGLTMPMWTLITFIGFIFYTIIWAILKNEQ
jgi:disulfide bond formation protein DsbB